MERNSVVVTAALKERQLAKQAILLACISPHSLGLGRVVPVLLEAIEAVARVAHHLAGLAHVPELPGELQQANNQ
jgi:hypothetical protein